MRKLRDLARVPDNRVLPVGSPLSISQIQIHWEPAIVKARASTIQLGPDIVICKFIHFNNLGKVGVRLTHLQFGVAALTEWKLKWANSKRRKILDSILSFRKLHSGLLKVGTPYATPISPSLHWLPPPRIPQYEAGDKSLRPPPPNLARNLTHHIFFNI